MNWDGYTIFSVISGVALIILAFVPDTSFGSGARLSSAGGGIAFIAYGIYVANQTSGTYYFPAWIFVIPFVAVGYVVLSVVSNARGPAADGARGVAPKPASTSSLNAQRQALVGLGGAPRNALVSPVRPQCPNCATKGEVGALFCLHCGASLGKAIDAEDVRDEACPACGAAGEPGDLFCSVCGAKRGAEAREDGIDAGVEPGEGPGSTSSPDDNPASGASGGDSTAPGDAATNLSCPSCGGVAEAGDVFCRACGSSLAGGAPEDDSPEVGAQLDTGVGPEAAPDADPPTSTGDSDSTASGDDATSVSCPSCGTVAEPGDVFCCVCGTALAGEALGDDAADVGSNPDDEVELETSSDAGSPTSAAGASAPAVDGAMKVSCPSCGTGAEPGDRFCCVCGADLVGGAMGANTQETGSHADVAVGPEVAPGAELTTSTIDSDSAVAGDHATNVPCPSCGTVAEAQDTFCSGCGAPLGDGTATGTAARPGPGSGTGPASAPLGQTAVSAPPATSICSACGSAATSGSRFCEMCGHALPAVLTSPPSGAGAFASSFAARFRNVPPELLAACGLMVVAAVLTLPPLINLLSLWRFEGVDILFWLPGCVMFGVFGAGCLALAWRLPQGDHVARALTYVVLGGLGGSVLLGSGWNSSPVLMVPICLVILAVLVAAPRVRGFFDRPSARSNDQPTSIAVARLLVTVWAWSAIVIGAMFLPVIAIDSNLFVCGLLLIGLGVGSLFLRGPLVKGNGAARLVMSFGAVVYFFLLEVLVFIRGDAGLLLPLALLVSITVFLWAPQDARDFFRDAATAPAGSPRPVAQTAWRPASPPLTGARRAADTHQPELPADPQAAWLAWAERQFPQGHEAQQTVLMAVGLAQQLGATTTGDVERLARSAVALNADIASVVSEPAAGMRALLAAGWDLPGLSEPPFALDAGERLLARTECNAWVWQAVPPTRADTLVGGVSRVGLAPLAVSSAVNVPTAHQAAYGAVARWQRVARGHSLLCVTNERVLLRPPPSSHWLAYPLRQIARLELSTAPVSVTIRITGSEATPFSYQMPVAPVWFALLAHLAAPSALSRVAVAPPPSNRIAEVPPTPSATVAEVRPGDPLLAPVASAPSPDWRSCPTATCSEHRLPTADRFCQQCGTATQVVRWGGAGE